ncbi:hypothetical protein BKG79_22400 [Mycobacteroides chelonae]|uniref:hypothetical protein n=1 Tax=Mycobacteroides chelonae TaxID=1774 RepID=UPI0008A9B63A|nr:hypothetical protein [Mycobacteroides chelonae]OHU33356.1 hypothetical protein BKG79_22400 [Mycobacteroides chelonae]
MVSQNSSNATMPHDTPPPDPEFHLNMVIMATQSALAALRRGDLTAAVGCADIAAEFVAAAQRDIVAVGRPNPAVVR